MYFLISSEKTENHRTDPLQITFRTKECCSMFRQFRKNPGTFEDNETSDCRSRRIFVCVSIDDYETNKKGREVDNLEEDEKNEEEVEDRELKTVSELVGGKRRLSDGSQQGLCLRS